MGTNDTLSPKLYQDPRAHASPDPAVVNCNGRVAARSLSRRGAGMLLGVLHDQVRRRAHVHHYTPGGRRRWRGTRDKKIEMTLNLQIRFNMFLLLSSKVVHAAALENGAIPTLTKAVLRLRLRRLGGVFCTVSSIVIFLKQAELIPGRGDAVRGITEAIEAGFLNSDGGELCVRELQLFARGRCDEHGVAPEDIPHEAPCARLSA